MDRSLDEIVSERHRGGRRQRNNGVGRRTEYPRDGVRKSIREDNRNIDSEWVHDKFDDNSRQPIRGRGGGGGRRFSPDRQRESAQLRVENIHYDLTEDELDHLFNRIGPVEKLVMKYDRSGRSDGLAFVTYERADDARAAIKEFDGANANGQPIHLSLVPSARPVPRPAGRRNPFDQIISSRPLAERITMRRSESPIRHSDVTKPPPDGVDRYIPGRGSRSPVPRRRREGGGGGGGARRDGRRPGARRERGERNGGSANGGRKENTARDGRPRKTQEQLDAEMEDYFGGGGGDGEAGGVDVDGNVDMNGAHGASEDIEMAL